MIHLDLFQEDYLMIATTLSKVGQAEKAEAYANSFKEFADESRTSYKNAYWAFYYAYRNDVKKAMEHLALFSKKDNYIYWNLLLNDDPVVDNIKDLPQFRKVMTDIENKFWATNKKIKVKLDKEGLP